MLNLIIFKSKPSPRPQNPYTMNNKVNGCSKLSVTKVRFVKFSPNKKINATSIAATIQPYEIHLKVKNITLFIVLLR